MTKQLLRSGVCFFLCAWQYLLIHSNVEPGRMFSGLHYELLQELWADITAHVKITRRLVLAPATDEVDVRTPHMALGVVTC